MADITPTSYGSTPVPQADNTPAPAAPILSGAAPDPTMSMEQGAVNAPIQNPKQPSLWSRILSGALQGALAGGAAAGEEGRGRQGFGQGFGEGVAGDLNFQRQQKIDAQRQKQSDSSIRFQDAQAANLTAETTLRDAQLHALPQQEQDAHNTAALAQLKEMQGMGLTPTLVIDNHAQGAKAGLQQLTDSHGAVPPMFTINLGDKIVGFDLNQLAQAPQALDRVNAIRAVTGQQPYDPQVWAQMDSKLKNEQINSAFSFYNPLPDEKSLLIYKNYLNTAQQQPDSPQKAANVAKLQGVVDTMQKSLDAANQRAIDQKAAGTKADTEARVEAEDSPAAIKAAGDKAGAIERAKNKADMDVLQGAKLPDGSWNQNSSAVQLVESQMAPSQLPKRATKGTNEWNTIMAEANQYSLQKYGKPYNAADADNAFHYANTTKTRDTLNQIKAMSDPGGEIDIAQTAFKSIPGKIPEQTFNKIMNGTITEFSGTSVTNFRTAMLGLADAYARVLGGGTATDTGRQQGLDIVKESYSRGQGAGAIDIIRQDVAARGKGMVGNNPFLSRQYPEMTGGTNAASTAPNSRVVPPGAFPGRDASGNIIGYKTADGKVVKF